MRPDLTREGHMAGIRLWLHRRESRTDAAALAKVLDVSRAALYRYEKGEVVKLDTVRRIGELLSLSFAEVIAPLSDAERRRIGDTVLGSMAGVVGEQMPVMPA